MTVEKETDYRLEYRSSYLINQSNETYFGERHSKFFLNDRIRSCEDCLQKVIKKMRSSETQENAKHSAGSSNLSIHASDYCCWIVVTERNHLIATHSISMSHLGRHTGACRITKGIVSLKRLINCSLTMA